MLPIINKFKLNTNSKVVIVADSGLLSKSSIEELVAQSEFILDKSRQGPKRQEEDFISFIKRQSKCYT